MSGTWLVNSISYEGLVENSVQSIFDMAPPTAFLNSTWTLTGSGNGTIALTNGTVQPIFWSLNDSQSPASFQFKKLNTGEKAKDVTTGYTMEVNSTDGNNVILRIPVDTGGVRAYIISTWLRSKHLPAELNGSRNLLRLSFCVRCPAESSRKSLAL